MFAIHSHFSKIRSIVWISFLILSAAWLVSCQHTTQKTKTLFTKIEAEQSGIGFINEIVETPDLHYYDYMHLLNGAGVALVDLDDDGLLDVVFTANMSGSKVYRNKGDFNFEDVTRRTGIDRIDGFVTGVSIGDVNGDDKADIYITRSGWYKDGKLRQNKLLVNQGNFEFSEQAETYGLADSGHSIHATFFDYDRDGLLDLYVVNTPVDFSLVGKVYDLEDIKTNPYTLQFGSTDHLYKNNGNQTFTDVTQKAGLFNEIGFGLNAQVSDLNEDGWPDIYISNDFISPDFTFINQQDGTFREASKKLFGHVSYNSMGADIADINNDGHHDIVVVDMSPANYKRSKTTMGMTDRKRFEKMVVSNYHHQYMHNMLQLNNGDGTFSEISQLAGIDKTDWSWAPLIADFDNDGWKDIFVTNGVLKDVQDRDTDTEVKRLIEEKKKQGQLTRQDFLEFSKMLPSVPLTNYIFKNKRDLTFEQKMEEWGIVETSFTNGAAYGDLDNDGDLDLVLNNINSPATIYENEGSGGHSVTISLKGKKGNPWAIGAKVTVWTGATFQTKESVLSRGYMSSVDPRLHFGLGERQSLDSLIVEWPDGRFSKYISMSEERFVSISQEDAMPGVQNTSLPQPITPKVELFEHRERHYDDFQQQVLLPHKLSQLGPALAVADVNGDGLEDFFVGGAHQQRSAVYVQTQQGEFLITAQPDIEQDKGCEDISAAFFDVDVDGDTDLVVGAGSYEFELGHPGNKDRLYLNDGQGNFIRSEKWPQYAVVTSVVVPFDIDNDGDLDVFMGSRVVPGRYPQSPDSFMLENTPDGFVHRNGQNELLLQLGMVTDAKPLDHDQDGDMDLVVAGGWMPVTVLVNDGGELASKEEIQGSAGWWNRLIVEDVDHDGILDIVAGNLGLNYKHHASNDKPFHVFGGDFDGNGTYDMMLAKHGEGNLLPVRGKSCSSEQMPGLAQRFPTYASFAEANVFEVIGGSQQIDVQLEAQEFRSGVFYGNTAKGFDFQPFPNTMQLSPITGICAIPQGASHRLITAGNLYESEVETTRADAGFGNVIEVKGDRKMSAIDRQQLQLHLPGNIKDMALIQMANGRQGLLSAVNDGFLTLHLVGK
ncbi:MAG: VCBS repeat-containing protein [Cyclobacteriaceae bacterium]